MNGGQGIDMVARLRAGGSVSSRAGAADFPIVGLEQQNLMTSVGVVTDLMAAAAWFCVEA